MARNKPVNIAEAKSRLPELVERAAQGEEIVIAKHLLTDRHPDVLTDVEEELPGDPWQQSGLEWRRQRGTLLDDEQIAGVLTYVRREWGHTYSAVTPALVKQVREETAKREDAWTEPELLKIP